MLGEGYRLNVFHRNIFYFCTNYNKLWGLFGFLYVSILKIYKIFLDGIEEGNTTHAHTRRGLCLLDEKT